jgi:hypothetical protein
MKKTVFLFISFIAMIYSSEPIDLSFHEASLYSQNGEDGVIAKMFQVIKPTSHFCVDLGASDGITDSNTYLLRLQGWDGLLLDRSFEIPNYKLYKQFLTKWNINQLLEQYSIPAEFDLLSIDVETNSFHIWNALSEHYKPAVVIIDYNSSLPPNEDKVVEYHPFFCGDGTNYYGASILALFKLGQSKGYSLVHATANNLIFVYAPLLKEQDFSFKETNDVAKLYDRMAHLSPPRPPDLKNRSYLTSDLFLREHGRR